MRSALFALFVLLPMAYGQNIGANLAGLVSDAQGLSVRGARVRLVSALTESAQEAETAPDGRFRFVSVAPGNYVLQITAAGLAPYRSERLTLQVGETQTVRAVLGVEAAAQSVTVAANWEAASTEKSYSAGLMNDLPMLAGGTGRNFRTQVYLTPGVTPATQAHRPFAVSGARSRNNNYMIDSNDYNEVEGGLLMGRGASEQLISTDALEGMQVITHNFKAEYGRQNGSIINMVTKRGGNDWHGTAYEYFRHHAIGTRNTFDLTRQPLKFHQFGGNIGGPLRRNRTFVFANAEAFLRREARTNTIQTLTPAQRAQAVPSVQALVALYPQPNLGANLFRSSVGAPGDQYSFVARADHEISPSQRLFSRSTLLTSNNVGVANAALTRYAGDVGSQGHSLHHIWSPNPSSLNEARFNYTRFRLRDAFPDPVQLGDPARNGEVGFVIVNGLTSLGHLPFWGRNTAQNNFQWTDDFSYTRSRHALKMGAALRRLQLNSGAVTTGFTGQMRFNNVADFLAGRPASYNRNVGNPYIGQRAIEWNSYFQDDWQIHSRVTLNLGVRYERNSVPTEVNGLIAAQYRFRPDRNNIAPRFGFAWRADRDGRTVVRGGYGIYYNVLELSFLGLTRFNPPLITNLVAANPQLPNVLANAQAAIPSGLVIPDPGSRQPYAQHYNLTVERQLFGPAVTLSAGYVGTKGLKMPRVSRPNGGDGLAQALRPDPSIGVVNRLETAARSRYDSLQSSVQYQRPGLLLRASYTYSKFLDDSSDFPSTNQNIDRGLLALDETNWRLNWGVSDLDVRHVANFAQVWDVPLFRNHRLLGGWSIQGITTLQSGRPFTLFSGTDNLIGSNNNRIADVPASLVRTPSARQAIHLAPGITRAQLTPARGTLGALGRNTERGDSLVSINIAVHKQFRINERLALQFRAEGFNITNTVNYNLPEPVLTAPSFGQALTALDSRQTQLALRLTW